MLDLVKSKNVPQLYSCCGAAGHADASNTRDIVVFWSYGSTDLDLADQCDGFENDSAMCVSTKVLPFSFFCVLPILFINSKMMSQ